MTPAGQSLNVIALISGGKDSFLSILQCQKLGHKIVALANLHPPKSDASHDEDLNSHLYQTAGHAVIPFYEQATGIPLYRREIKGSASRLEREYDASYLSSEHGDVYDETEDLLGLLQDILSVHTTANAVCSGAILSNYQRTRIEDVCLRLSLIPLAYLWQMSLPLPSTSEDTSASQYASLLLDYFATVELDARIVKVASGGLDESYLGQSLSDIRVRQRIKNAMRRFGGSVVGEGGEFETLVLSGPSSLFKGRINLGLDACQVGRGQGGEAWLDIDASKIQVEGSIAGEVLTNDDKVSVEYLAPSPHAPPHVQAVTQKSLSALSEQSEQSEQGHEISFQAIKSRTAKYGRLIWLGNMHSGVKTRSYKHEMELIVERLRRLLLSERLESTSLVFATIILRDMNGFQEINAVWKALFSRPLPPARVTVAAGSRLPADARILLSCIAITRNRDQKSGLHVQSMSYWAPANIGPYSQAISIPVGNGSSGTKAVFIAGQIPLVPETMLPATFEVEDRTEEFRRQAVLSLRHARRVAGALNVCWFGYGAAFVCSDDILQAQERANIAFSVWKAIHEGLLSEPGQEDQDEGPDVWDLEFGGQKSFATESDEAQSIPSARALRTRQAENQIPGFLAIEVESLPRKQMVEWQTIGFSTGKVNVKQENSFTTSCELYGDNEADCCAFSTVIVVTQQQRQELLPGISARKGFTTVYGSAQNLSEQSAAEALIPCYRLWGPVNGELVELDYGLVIQWFGDDA